MRYGLVQIVTYCQFCPKKLQNCKIRFKVHVNNRNLLNFTIHSAEVSSERSISSFSQFANKYFSVLRSYLKQKWKISVFLD